MKKFTYIILISLLFYSCQTTSTNLAWEDMKTAGRYMHRSISTLIGKNKAIPLTSSPERAGNIDEYEFIAIQDKDTITYEDIPIPYTPVDNSVALNDFYSPDTQLAASIFKIIHFETDDHVVRTKEDINNIKQICDFLKKKPNLYICIEGHCDERASSEYNIALGTRRATHIKTLFLKENIQPNRLYTLSYGKEKPLSLGRTAMDWKINRRVQFKIFDKN